MTDHEAKQTHIIVLVTSYWEGLFQSVLWFLALGAAIAYAVWIGSTAMQWVMGIFWFLLVTGWAVRKGDSYRMTVDDAMKRLEDIKAGRADD